jgi:hypothetical protein
LLTQVYKRSLSSALKSFHLNPGASRERAARAIE